MLAPGPKVSVLIPTYNYAPQQYEIHLAINLKNHNKPAMDPIKEPTVKVC